MHRNRCKINAKFKASSQMLLKALGVHFCRKKVFGGSGFEWLWRPYSATNRKKGHPIDAKIIKNQGCVADAFFGWPWAPKGCKYYLSSGPLWRPFSVKNRGGVPGAFWERFGEPPAKKGVKFRTPFGDRFQQKIKKGRPKRHSKNYHEIVW